MGYRLHYAKTYDVTYGGGYLNHCDGLNGLIAVEMPDSWLNENEDDGELLAAEVEQYVEKLKAMPSNKPNDYIIEVSNGQILEMFEDMLVGYDRNNNYIHIAWF